MKTAVPMLPTGIHYSGRHMPSPSYNSDCGKGGMFIGPLYSVHPASWPDVHLAQTLLVALFIPLCKWLTTYPQLQYILEL